MGSLEDLRDFYKSSTKSKHMDIKSNGSTYSNAYRKEIYKRGNVVQKTNVGGRSADNYNDIDERYGISSTNVLYSLNKKGRWRMALDLKQNMPQFAENDEDVRLYETRNRILSSYDDCIGYVSSKGKASKVRATYANKESIKRSLKLEAERARHPNDEETATPQVNKSNRKHKTTRKAVSRDFIPERIVIDLNENENDDDDDAYAEYEIQYPPSMEVLKYNTLFETKRKDWVASRVTKNILGDEFDVKNLNNFDYLNDADEDYYVEDQEQDKASEMRKRKNVKISLAELINEYTKPIVEKRRDDMKNSKRVNVTNEKELRKMIFISRQNSRIDGVVANKAFQRQASIRQAVAAVAETASVEVIQPIVVQMSVKSLETEKLKQKFGLRFCEAFNVWPRMMSVSLNDDIVEEMNYHHKLTSEQYDIRAWLCVKEILNAEKKNEEESEYCISLKANLSDIDLNTLDLSQVSDFEVVYQKIVELVARQPLAAFKVKEKAVAASSRAIELVDDLPNIAAKSVCKDADDLKLEFINKTSETNENNSDTASSSESSAADEELDEVKVKETLDEMFKTQTCSCQLCFEENLPIQNCTILLNCAHSICNTCWKDYIDVLVSNTFSNAGKLQCPVCDVDLELALIVNFVSDINKFEQYLSASIERVANVMFNYKWCQSPGCNKAIKVDFVSTPFGVLSCECGYKTCLKCNMTPHFPAKCSQVASYYSELKATNHFTVPKNEIYLGTGKKCPNCHVFMEKNGGCNQMVCTMCKEAFCWNCVNLWADHLKLTGNQHSCTISNANSKKQVTVEFKKDNHPLKPKDQTNLYANCVFHREQRAKRNVRERNENIKRLLNTIKQGELITENFEKLALVEQCKLELQKRDETRRFLQKMLSFLNELHFVCEHSYLLLRDHSAKQRSQQIFKIIQSIELVIWKIHNIFSNGSGKLALCELEEQMRKGLNCLNILNNFN